jgi:hypothetical protein
VTEHFNNETKTRSSIIAGATGPTLRSTLMGPNRRAQERARAAAEAAARPSKQRPSRKAIAEAEKIVAIGNARQNIAFQSEHWAYGNLLTSQSAERVVTMRWTSRIAISLVLLTLAGVARAGNEDEVRALFAKFVAAQNAHDLKTVGELLRHSPQFL